MTDTLTRSEIQSQPAMWRRSEAEVARARELLTRPGESVLFLGCGTSAFVSRSLALLRESHGFGLSDVAVASEWRPGRHYDAVVALTRSGTTTEVLDVLRAIGGDARRVAIHSTPGSPVEALVDDVLDLGFADESSVVQTRFPTTVLYLARRAFGEALDGVAEQAEEALAAPPLVDVSLYDHYVSLGTGWTFGLAEEAALKIREAAQAWSESYPSAEYRHGPIAVAGPRTLVTLFGTGDPRLESQVRATGAHVLATDVDPLVQLIHAQRIAVDLAAHRGLSPDSPRNLTRSVILA